MERHLVWHYDVHRQHAQEDLRFYLLKFSPSYDREIIFESFKKFCADNGIISYGLYEVFGPVDLVFRCWLPHENWFKINTAFDNWKGQISPNCRVGETEQFDIRSCRHQYLWADSSRAQILPDLSQLSLMLPKNGEKTYNALVLNGADPFIEQNFLRRIESVAPAIRFFIVVSAPQSGMPDAAKEELLDRICSMAQSFDGIQNLHLYEGSGTSFVMIDGEFEFTRFSLLADLQIKLRTTGIAAYQCRTSTYLCVDNIGAVYERDDLRINTLESEIFHDAPLTPVEELLSLDETEKLELKGSLRMNLYAYFTNGQVTSDKNLEDAVLKTIVAFRNTDGGDLIIGGAEFDRFPEKAKEKLESGYPKVGKYYLCGIDPDWKQKGTDKFIRHVLDMVASRIGHATASEIKVECVVVNEIMICRINVPKPRVHSFEYLDETHFFIRRGPASIELTGRDQEEHQRRRLVHF
jgi:hypothetical protein